jgi:hypothetical protein
VQGLLVILVIVVLIPIGVAVIIGRIADRRLVIVIVVTGARAIRPKVARGQMAMRARSNDEGPLVHAGGMRKF